MSDTNKEGEGIPGYTLNLSTGSKIWMGEGTPGRLHITLARPLEKITEEELKLPLAIEKTENGFRQVSINLSREAFEGLIKIYLEKYLPDTP